MGGWQGDACSCERRRVKRARRDTIVKMSRKEKMMASAFPSNSP